MHRRAAPALAARVRGRVDYLPAAPPGAVQGAAAEVSPRAARVRGRVDYLPAAPPGAVQGAAAEVSPRAAPVAKARDRLGSASTTANRSATALAPACSATSATVARNRATASTASISSLAGRSVPARRSKRTAGSNFAGATTTFRRVSSVREPRVPALESQMPPLQCVSAKPADLGQIQVVHWTPLESPVRATQRFGRPRSPSSVRGTGPLGDLPRIHRSRAARRAAPKRGPF
jgi:hypothetical protein